MQTPVLQKSSNATKAVTFAERFCAHHGVAPDTYEKEMLRRSLYPLGRPLLLLLGSNASYFAPDREFVRGVGKLTRVHGFGAEVWAFTVNPENSRFHRLRLKMRVSAKRVYVHLNKILRPDHPVDPSGDSVPPM